MTEPATAPDGTARRPRGPLSGVFAAALTPLCSGGATLDLDAVGGLVEFYDTAGLDGLFVGGTTGESLMLTLAERRALTEVMATAARGRMRVAVNVGAQTTADTVRLAEMAAGAGVDAVAVAPPPFFAFDDAALLAHLQAAAAAVAPLPFYLYEIRPRTGYAIPLDVVRELIGSAPNLVGMKVSDPTLEELQTYLLPELDVMVGAEALVAEGVARGATGAVSGLAGALPRHVVAALAEWPTESGTRLGELRRGMERFPFHAAGKLALGMQGVAIEPWVRPPLRRLTAGEQEQLEAWLASELQAVAGPRR